MQLRKYAPPAFLVSQGVADKRYTRWLSHKAKTHLKRDRARTKNSAASRESYMLAIHSAVIRSEGNDAYTGEALHWHLISTYDSDAAKVGGKKYRSTYALLPSADHVGDGSCSGDFLICACRTNDAKSDLDFADFLALCQRVVARAGVLEGQV